MKTKEESESEIENDLDEIGEFLVILGYQEVKANKKVNYP